MGVFKKEQLKEISFGLDKREKGFLWLVREPPSDDVNELPHSVIVDGTRHLKKWLLGCLPMVAWPLFAEQKMNRVYLVKEIKVALRLKMSTGDDIDGSNDGNAFDRLGHRRQSILERLSDTYSPSTTKSGPSRASSRDFSYSGGRSLNRDHPRVRDRLRGVEESYDDTYSSRRTRTKYRDRSRDRNHSCGMKRWRENESPLSRGSESSTSNGGH
ncbi:hypothetical protein Tco_0886046 [Tanacetum coccineum]